MTRARRDYRGEDENEREDSEREGEVQPPPTIELRYVYTAAHAELQYRHGNSGEWSAVPYVKRDEVEAGETIEGEAEDVSGQAQIEAKPEKEE